MKNNKNKNKNNKNFKQIFKLLDKKTKNSNKISNNEMDIIISQINNDYKKKYKSYYNYLSNTLHDNGDFLENKEPQIININNKIENLKDLIKIVNTYPLLKNVEYNIDLQVLYKVKDDLVRLDNMIGMENLKINILDQILYYIQNLYNFKKDSGDFMHTILIGPPGTGKTEVAKIIGSIFSKMNILPENTFIKVTRADLIAGYVGQTAIKTRNVIKQALGGVLFIDEAYSLGNLEKQDSFCKECIDILCEALSDHKDNLMVIIAGYEKELNECFFNYNIGLESRFIWKYKIDNYNGEELMKIFLKKVKDAEWSICENFNINKEWFEKNIKYFKYFGRSIEILFTKIKIAHSRRIFGKNNDIKKKINLSDMNEGLKMINIKNTNDSYKLLYN